MNSWYRFLMSRTGYWRPQKDISKLTDLEAVQSAKLSRQILCILSAKLSNVMSKLLLLLKLDELPPRDVEGWGWGRGSPPFEVELPEATPLTGVINGDVAELVDDVPPRNTWGVLKFLISLHFTIQIIIKSWNCAAAVLKNSYLAFFNCSVLNPV